jgi:osmotically-inducible protein OsmY
MNDRATVHEWAFPLFLVVASALAGCATFGGCPSDSCRDDAKITKNVEAQLTQRRDLEPNVINVQTRNHVVYLSGLVSSGLEGYTAEEIASATPGVSRVVNSIVTDN